MAKLKLKKKSPEADVGYCKPPKQHQFKKGKSGNPKGRPKGSINFKTALEKELISPVNIKVGKQVSQVSKMEAAVKGIVGKVMSGQPAMATLLAKLLADYQIGLDDGGPTKKSLTQEELEVLHSHAEFLLLIEEEDSNEDPDTE